MPDIPPPILSPVMSFDNSDGVILSEKHLLQVQDYFKEHKWIPVEVERLVFSRELLVAGQLDTIVIDETGNYTPFHYQSHIASCIVM